METFCEVGGILVWVVVEADASGFVVGPDVRTDAVEVADYGVR